MTVTTNEVDRRFAEAAQALIVAWVFPGEAVHTPDVDTIARADKLGRMLVSRMTELSVQGVDPVGMTMAQLLPGVFPDEIELTEADY